MNRTMRVFVLAVGMVAMASVAASRIYDDGSRLVVFSSEPIPCHVYLKAKHSVETSLTYGPNSFFQVKVQILRMEPDVIRIQQTKKFLQGRLDMPEDLQVPNFSERIYERIEYIEDKSKLLTLRVLETLEGPSPGEEIIIPSNHTSKRHFRALIQDKTKRYLLGFRTLAGQVLAVMVKSNDLYVKDDGFLTDAKLWVRRLFSECDNV